MQVRSVSKLNDGRKTRAYTSTSKGLIFATWNDAGEVITFGARESNVAKSIDEFDEIFCAYCSANTWDAAWSGGISDG